MAARGLEINQIAWPVNRLGELTENLARKAGLTARLVRLSQPPDNLSTSSDSEIGAWLDNAAGYLDLEAEPVSAQYNDLDLLLQAGGPAILRLPDTQVAGEPTETWSTSLQPRFLALLKGARGKAVILCPDLRLRRLSLEALRALLTHSYDAYLAEQIDQVLVDAEVPVERLPRARKAILRDQLGSMRIEAGWLLRLPPSASLHNQFRHAGVYRPVAIMMGMYFIQQLLSVASWFVIGRGIFQGHFDMGWLLAWAILLLSTIPVQIIVSDAQSELSMGAGALFKQRLILGTLKLDPEEIRHLGMGQFLNRVMESEAVEMLALSGGFTALLSFIELGMAVIILLKGASGSLSAVSLVVWIIITLILLWRYYRTSREWTDAYREMTNHLVEEMVGHRTRLIQQDPRRWHQDEDQELDRYLKLSESMDNIGMLINSFITRGWILVGLAGIALAFVAANPTPQALAVSLGGILLASQGLGKLTAGAQSLSSLANAWQQVGPLFKAADRPRQLPALGFTPPASGETPVPSAADQVQVSPNNGKQTLVQARDLSFRYRPLGRPILQDCTLQIYPGDRLLLEGPSGGGKSTLAAVLTGLRAPESGSLLLWGFDRQLLGVEEWRKRVVMAPQFQENYVFSETLAFNLLLGRRWPPTPEDLEEAELICQELGLGDVLHRMPSGFQQMLGESGWQLSHGERSRLFIARTLLQKADLIVLDESFGALDPENLERALQCVLRRAPTLLVIAHP
jgi:ABC-type multidrug transport system fused ATPase/permease subunit